MSSSISSLVGNISLASIKNSLDEVRAQVYPRNETERKVYEALSSKNWGASSTLMNEIASESNDYEKYGIMSPIIWAALDTDGKSWKQIFKALTLIEFLIKNGSERFIEASRDKMFKIRNLQDFNYYEGTIDKGSGVREKAKQIVELLGSNESIRAERDKARQLRNKFIGIDSRNAGGGGYGNDSYSSGGSYASGGVDSYSGGGRYGGDSYSGGGGGGGGGRYGGDSYGNDSGSGGGRYGGDSYRDRDSGNNNSNSGNSRYGGGAYDSDRPPRYGDDAPERDTYNSRSSNNNNSSNSYGRDEDNESPFRSGGGSSSASTAKASTGKFKVNINKKPGSPTSTAKKTPAAPAAAAAEVDLFGDSQADFMSAPVAPAGGNNLFDAFSAPAAPAAAAAFDPFGAAPAAPPAAAAAAFDPFAAAPPAPPAAAPVAFDPFASAPAPVFAAAAPSNNNNFGSFAAAPAAPVYQNNNNYNNQFSGMSAPAPVAAAPMNNFNNNFGGNNVMGGGMGGMQTQRPAQQQQQQYGGMQSAPASIKSGGNLNSADNDFGDFEGPATTASTAQSAKPAAANKWGDLGGLVDLSNVKKNDVAMAKTGASSTQNAYSQQAFAGLDGFSKTPQSMSAANSNRPMGYMAPNNAPQQPSMMSRPAPTGPAMNTMMGSGAPMGGNMGGAPMMGGGMGGMGMGGGMMGGGYQPQPGGFGGPAPMGGGYPNNNMMMGGGQGGYGQPNMMGGGMGGMPNNNMMGGGFPQQGGYQQNRPGGW